MRDVLYKANRFCFAALVPVCLFLLILAPAVLEAWMGPGFGATAGGPLRVLALALIVNAAAWPTYQLLLATGNPGALARIQAALLPQESPKLQGCSVAALSVPARVVGGDFYDYLELPDGRTAFLVADVAGKGVSAGLVMTAVRSAARSVFAYTDSPHEALIALNEHVLRDFERSTFVTMIAMMLDRDRRRLRITNAGHPPILHVHGSTGRASLLNTQGAAVGVLDRPLHRDPLPR